MRFWDLSRVQDSGFGIRVQGFLGNRVQASRSRV